MDSRFRPARIVEAVATSPMRERGAEIRAFPFSSVAVSGRCEWESPRDITIVTAPAGLS